MRELSLFSGAGGGLLATKHLLGWETVGYVEYEEYCQRVIRQRISDGLLDDAPLFGDIRTFISEGYAESYQGMVDVVTGGFPCTDISAARSVGFKGIEGEESGLWKEMASVIRLVKPRYAFVENSPILTVRGLGTVLRDLAEMGYHATWGVLGGQAAYKFGLLRERIWIVAFDNEIDVKRLQIQKRIDVESILRGYPASSNLSDVETSWFVANGYAVREVNDDTGTVDRIKAVGNMWLPIVAATAWEILTS